MKEIVVACLLACALVAGAVAQKKMKPWGEWSEKDARKILDVSTWAQTQVETNTSEMFYRPTTRDAGGAGVRCGRERPRRRGRDQPGG